MVVVASSHHPLIRLCAGRGRAYMSLPPGKPYSVRSVWLAYQVRYVWRHTQEAGPTSPFDFPSPPLRSCSGTMRGLAALSAVAVGFLALSAAAGGINGDATYTEASKGGGTCSFANYTFPPNIFGTGLGPANWSNGTKCGSCLQVEGPRGSAKVMVCIRIPSLKYSGAPT